MSNSSSEVQLAQDSAIKMLVPLSLSGYVHIRNKDFACPPNLDVLPSSRQIGLANDISPRHRPGAYGVRSDFVSAQDHIAMVTSPNSAALARSGCLGTTRTL